VTGAIQQVRLPWRDTELSGLFADTADPVALVVALPGGGMTAGYFHGELHPSVSLLRLGTKLGYAVLALDRPGYGASAGIADEHTALAAQADIIWEALQHASLAASDVPVLLLGHSFGAMVALQMAGRDPAPLPLWGIDFSGIGTHYAEVVLKPQADTDLREMHWGSEQHYPKGTFDPTNLPTARLPGVEALEALRWQERVAAVVSAVRCPVRITVAEGELNWINDPNDFAALFINAESVGVDILPRSGHNISLSWAARAYHLRVMAFFDDCVRLRRYLTNTAEQSG
jgi:pimeloyl-ACP methyl ester carboxylesterase